MTARMSRESDAVGAADIDGNAEKTTSISEPSTDVSEITEDADADADSSVASATIAPATGTPEATGDGATDFDAETVKPTIEESLARERVEDKYEIERDPFATGSFGEFWRGHHKQTGVEVVITRNRIGEEGKLSRRQTMTLEEFQYRLHFQSVLGNHVGFCGVHDTFEDGENHMVIVMERCQGVNLCKYLDQAGDINEDTARDIIRPCLRALVYAHGHRIRIVHGDIRIENIMFDGRDVRIIDCGKSFPLEMLGGGAADVQRLAAVTYELLTGGERLLNQRIVDGGDDLREELSAPEYARLNALPNARDFVQELLTGDVSAAQALRHRWLA